VSVRDEIRRMLRDLRWIAPILIVAAVVIGLRMDDGLDEVAVLLAIGVALTPLAWLRWSGHRPRDGGEVRTSFKAIGLAMAWAFAVVIIVVVSASILG
jgi:hypothetical protein